MAKAKRGQKVSHRRGGDGIISSVVGHIAHVVWKDGSSSYVPTDSLFKGGKGCAVYVLAALSLGPIITAGVWLL